MNAVNYSDLRKNLKTYLDRVYDDQETIIIARRDNENVVMISIDEYNSLVYAVINDTITIIACRFHY